MGHGGLQGPGAARHAPPPLPFRQQGAPALHRVEPGGAGGREMHVEARPWGQPLPHPGGLVGAVMVRTPGHVQVGGHRGRQGVQELAARHRAMPSIAWAEGAVGLDVKGRAQGGDAVPYIILGAVQGLDRGLLIPPQDPRAVGGWRYRPTMSRTVAMKHGAVDNWKVAVRGGGKVMARVLPCVASGERVSRVRATTRSTSASVTVRGTPNRGASGRPSRRWARHRDRHWPTVAGDPCHAAATAVCVGPGTQRSMMRARGDRAGAVWGRRCHCARVSVSASVRVRGGRGRPGCLHSFPMIG